MPLFHRSGRAGIPVVVEGGTRVVADDGPRAKETGGRFGSWASKQVLLPDLFDILTPGSKGIVL